MLQLIKVIMRYSKSKLRRNTSGSYSHSLVEKYEQGLPLNKFEREHLKKYLVAKRFLEALPLEALHEIADTFVDPRLKSINNRSQVIAGLLRDDFIVQNVLVRRGEERSFILHALKYELSREEVSELKELVGLHRGASNKKLFEEVILFPGLPLEQIAEAKEEVAGASRKIRRKDKVEPEELEPELELEPEPEILTIDKRSHYYPRVVEFMIEQFLLPIESEGPPLTLEEFAATHYLDVDEFKDYYQRLADEATIEAKEKIKTIRKRLEEQEELEVKFEQEEKRQRKQEEKKLKEEERKRLRDEKRRLREEKRRQKRLPQRVSETEPEKPRQTRTALRQQHLEHVIDYLAKEHNLKLAGKSYPMKKYASHIGISYPTFVGWVKKYREQAIPHVEDAAQRLRQAVVQRQLLEQKQQEAEQKEKLLREHAIQFIVESYVTRDIEQKRKYGLTLRAYAKKHDLPYVEFLKFYKEHQREIEAEADRRIRKVHLMWLQEFHKQDVGAFEVYMRWARTPIGVVSRAEEDFWLTVAEDVRQHGLIKPLFSEYKEEIIPVNLAEIFRKDEALAAFGSHLDPSISFMDLTKTEQREILRTRIINVLEEFGILELPTREEILAPVTEPQIPYLPERTLSSAVLNYLHNYAPTTAIPIEQLPNLIFRKQQLKINETQLRSVLKKMPEVEVSGENVNLKSDIVLKCVNGRKTIRFATTLDGMQPARHEWESLTNKERATFMHLFNILCQRGEITNRTQFAKLKDRPHLFAFKSQRHKLRIVCYFHGDDVFLLRIFQKKEDQYRPGELEAAEKVRQEHQIRLASRKPRRRNPFSRNFMVPGFRIPYYPRYPRKRHYGRFNVFNY